MSEIPKKKPYIFTCLNCGENMYDKQDRASHICKIDISKKEKLSLLKELNSLEQRITVIKKKIQMIKNKESKVKKPTKTITKKNKIEEAEISEQ